MEIPAEQRAQMLVWALDKVAEQAPSVKKETVSMLCRAENRTLMALLNSKSAAQTKQVLQAAYRRAGLKNPWAEGGGEEDGANNAAVFDPTHLHQMEQKFEEHFEGMKMLMANQIATTSNITGAMACLPSMQQHQHLADLLEQVQHTNLEALGIVMKRLTEMEARIGVWETAILPHILDRLPVQAPGTPQTHAEEETPNQQTPPAVVLNVQGTSRVTEIEVPASMDITTPTENPQDLTGRVLSELQSGMLTTFEDRSLRTQASKVVSSTAMLPFRASK